ncbi:hypothetical protein MANES_16G130000v8 [Manihot esculenta]|uniref:Uncharacterized protein n=1 Tax=Manihot esculenta TaxID=3983 RepID=A0ACB7G8Z9_MANES|nr:hypothetical protein MANES_16G130000v8 [Manihot esculenta]
MCSLTKPSLPRVNLNVAKFSSHGLYAARSCLKLQGTRGGMRPTHNMNPEEVKAAGFEGSKSTPGHNPGGFLHQRGKLPFSPTTMTITGLVIAASVGYMVWYAKKKPEASPRDVAKVSTNSADPKDTHPRK